MEKEDSSTQVTCQGSWHTCFTLFCILYLSLWINWNNSREKFSVNFDQWMPQVSIFILAGIQSIGEIVWSLPLIEHEDT